MGCGAWAGKAVCNPCAPVRPPSCRGTPVTGVRCCCALYPFPFPEPRTAAHFGRGPGHLGPAAWAVPQVAGRTPGSGSTRAVKLGLSLSCTPDGRVFVAAVEDPPTAPAGTAASPAAARSRRRRSSSRARASGGVGPRSDAGSTAGRSRRSRGRSADSAASGWSSGGSTSGASGRGRSHSPASATSSVYSCSSYTELREQARAGELPHAARLRVFDEMALPVVDAHGLSPVTGLPVTPAYVRPGLQVRGAHPVQPPPTVCGCVTVRRKMCREVWCVCGRGWGGGGRDTWPSIPDLWFGVCVCLGAACCGPPSPPTHSQSRFPLHPTTRKPPTPHPTPSPCCLRGELCTQPRLPCMPPPIPTLCPVPAVCPCAHRSPETLS